MHSGSNNDYLFLGYCILIVKLVGDRNDGYIDTAETLGQDLEIEDLIVKVHLVGNQVLLLRLSNLLDEVEAH